MGTEHIFQSCFQNTQPKEDIDELCCSKLYGQGYRKISIHHYYYKYNSHTNTFSKSKFEYFENILEDKSYSIICQLSKRNCSSIKSTHSKICRSCILQNTLHLFGCCFRSDLVQEYTSWKHCQVA